MNSLQELIPKIQQAREERNIYRLSTLAEQALEATLDEKLIKSGSLQWLANRLSDVIKEFEKTDIRIDDLRYRLAHLYMRSQKWEEANDQLLELEESDYCKTEAQIYSALCSIKQGFQPDISRIAEQWNKMNTVKTKSIQEQHYDLLEMLVYAADLDYLLLDSYYKKGSTKADLEIRYFDCKLNTNSGLSWQPIARHRLIQLLNLCKNQGFLILDLRKNKSRDIEGFTTFIQTATVKKLAEVLALRYPQLIEFDNLKAELEEFRKPELRARLKKENEQKKAKEEAKAFEHCDSLDNEDEDKERDSAIIRISEWKGKLCQILKQQSGTENSIVVHNKTYRLEHSFMLVQKRSRG